MGAPEAQEAFELRRAGDLTVLRWPALDDLGVEVVVTTRDGGVSTGSYRSLNLALHVGDDPGAVEENRRRAAAALGAGLEDLVLADQVHGRTATVVTRDHRGRGTASLEDAVPGTDALVTGDPGPVLVTLVADCVPIVLVDPSVPVLATVHAGWRGTAARVVDAALEAMARAGSRPAGVVAGIGPAVSPRAYEVGDEVAAAFRACLGDGAIGVLVPAPDPAGRPGGGPGGPTGDARRAGGARWLVNLWEANRRILEAAGVPAGAIHVADVPTGDGGPFYSDRAARPCGRFGLLARLRP